MRTGVQHRGFVPVSVVELLLVCLEGYCKWNRLLEWKTDWWHQSQQLTIGLKLYCCIILIKKGPVHIKPNTLCMLFALDWEYDCVSALPLGLKLKP